MFGLIRDLESVLDFEDASLKKCLVNVAPLLIKIENPKHLSEIIESAKGVLEIQQFKAFWQGVINAVLV